MRASHMKPVTHVPARRPSGDRRRNGEWGRVSLPAALPVENRRSRGLWSAAPAQAIKRWLAWAANERRVRRGIGELMAPFWAVHALLAGSLPVLLADLASIATGAPILSVSIDGEPESRPSFRREDTTPRPLRIVDDESGLRWEAEDLGVETLSGKGEAARERATALAHAGARNSQSATDMKRR